MTTITEPTVEEVANKLLRVIRDSGADVSSTSRQDQFVLRFKSKLFRVIVVEE